MKSGVEGKVETRTQGAGGQDIMRRSQDILVGHGAMLLRPSG